jgi:hypothetical protein
LSRAAPGAWVEDADTNVRRLVMRLLRARRRLALFFGVSILIVAAPVAVIAAANHNFSGNAERQAAKWRTAGASISGTGWHDVPGLGMTKCTVREVSETATLTVSGGPVRFRAVTDGVPEAPLKPGVVRFVPNGKESVTYTFVGNTAPFEADDDHRFEIQWQSPTGATITLHSGVVNLVFQKGTQSCS